MTTQVKNKTVAQIAELNDRFRKVGAMSVSLRVFNLPEVLDTIKAVRDFNNFTELRAGR